GREPTRKRPRSASASGVFVRDFRARIRSHGLSTPRRTAVSKTPPPETSRYAKPAPSRSSARRSRSAVGMRPASGSWLRTRIVVSTRRGMGQDITLSADSARIGRTGRCLLRGRLRALYVALFAWIELDLVADIHEE